MSYKFKKKTLYLFAVSHNEMCSTTHLDLFVWIPVGPSHGISRIVNLDVVNRKVFA